jgi:hypothetical protein
VSNKKKKDSGQAGKTGPAGFMVRLWYHRVIEKLQKLVSSGGLAGTTSLQAGFWVQNPVIV